MPRTRSPYLAEFRDQIVLLARALRSVESLAREFEPCTATIHGWVRLAMEGDGDSLELMSGEPDKSNQEFYF